MLYISVNEIKYGTVGATFNVAFSVPIEELPLLRELHDKYAELNMKSFSLTARQADTPQTDCAGSPIGDYRDGVGAWQTDCGWGKPTTVSHREDKED